jgi:hypothetical protein
MPSTDQTSHQTFSSTTETFSIQYIVIRLDKRNFSVLTAKLIVLPRLMVVIFKMDKNLVFSTFDPRFLTLDLDF